MINTDSETIVSDIDISKSKFYDLYVQKCAEKKLAPLPAIKLQKENDVLEFYGDDVSFNEWIPIIKSISQDKFLQFIAVRMKNLKNTILEHIDNESKVKTVTKRSVLLTRFVLNKFINAIGRCVSNSINLSCLAIEGVPLKLYYLFILSQGLNRNNTIQHLSLKSCIIGDEGCELLCQVLRHNRFIITVNLSDNNLTQDGANSIAKLINYQKIYRYSTKWKENFDNKYVDVEKMSGLRRITINCNENIKNEGIILLGNAVHDDLWIKAIDAQCCGVDNLGAQYVANVLLHNKVVEVFDLRCNGVSTSTLEGLILILNKNAVHENRYNWLCCPKRIPTVMRSASNLQDTKKPPLNMLKRNKTSTDLLPLAKYGDTSKLPVIFSIINWDKEKRMSNEERKLIDAIKNDEKSRKVHTQELNKQLQDQYDMIIDRNNQLDKPGKVFIKIDLVNKISLICDQAIIFIKKLKIWSGNMDISIDEIVNKQLIPVEEKPLERLLRKISNIHTMLPIIKELLESDITKDTSRNYKAIESRKFVITSDDGAMERAGSIESCDDNLSISDLEKISCSKDDKLQDLLGVINHMVRIFKRHPASSCMLDLDAVMNAGNTHKEMPMLNEESKSMSPRSTSDSIISQNTIIPNLGSSSQTSIKICTDFTKETNEQYEVEEDEDKEKNITKDVKYEDDLDHYEVEFDEDEEHKIELYADSFFWSESESESDTDSNSETESEPDEEIEEEEYYDESIDSVDNDLEFN